MVLRDQTFKQGVVSISSIQKMAVAVAGNGSTIFDGTRLVFGKNNTSYVGVSKNSRSSPKSSILIGFSIINHPFWGSPIFGNTHVNAFELTCLINQSHKCLGVVILWTYIVWLPENRVEWIKISKCSCSSLTHGKWNFTGCPDLPSRVSRWYMSLKNQESTYESACLTKVLG